MVVVLFTPARFRGNERVGVHLPRSTPRRFSTASRNSCGDPRSGRSATQLVSWVFLRLFGAIYVAAFASLGVQILGLIGHDGILPLGEYLQAAHQALGNSAYRLLPSLFWVNSSDTALVAGTVVGVVLGLLVIVDRWTRPALIGLFALYLSYVYAGQDFMSFQWDALLLEAGFLAIFLTGGSRIVVWLYRWLVFRYLFLAGAVKLLSGDPTWRDLTALEYHFWTQPLPTPLAWYAAQLPTWLLIGGTAATLAVELGCVFLIFLPRRLRAAAGVLRAAVSITDRADRQLQLLQSAHDAVVRLSVR